MVFTFTVPGNPVPQPRARVSTRGGFARAYTPTKHPIHAYRAAIVAAARAAGAKVSGPARLEVVAVFERPASHWLKSGLKRDAPAWPKGDGDNVAKGVADALTDAGVWQDDSCVVEWLVRKHYCDRRHEHGQTVITVSAPLSMPP